jgi:hypothetical protein
MLAPAFDIEVNTCMTHKEAYRLFWMVKGHIAESDDTALLSADSYFKRLWVDGSNGAPLYEYEEGFEQAYNRRFHNGTTRHRNTE